MIYFDTAYILKCYINENGSEDIRTLASHHDEIACSEFGKVELSAAFQRALREGFIDLPYSETIFEQFHRDEHDGVWTWLPFNRDIMDSVVSNFESLPATTYLRAGDAIHLRCAFENGIVNLFTNDRHMLSAANEFGLHASDVIGTSQTD